MLEKNPIVPMPSEPSLGQELGAFVWETIKIVVISLVIFFPIRYYLLQPFFVKGASMESTLEDGDYIFIDEVWYQLKDPRRGDVVVFRYPLDQSQFFIKRVIGLPGETLEIKNNQVIIYNKIHPKGQVLPEPYLEPGQQTLGQMRIKLDDNEYFVLGDNRAKSSDSRRWGAVNRSLITGRAFIRLWPLNDGIRVPHISYPI